MKTIGNIDEKSIIEDVVDVINDKLIYKIMLYEARDFSELKYKYTVCLNIFAYLLYFFIQLVYYIILQKQQI